MSLLDNIASSAYSGAATVGTIGADVQLIFVIAFAILFIGIALWVWWNQTPVTNDQNGHKTVGKMSGGMVVVIIGVALLIVALVVLNWYFTQTYKPYAAFSGASDIYRML